MESVKRKKRGVDYLIIFYLKCKACLYSLLHIKGVLQIRKVKREHKGIQLKMAELLKIIHAIEEFEECRLLIFGLGNDSSFWNAVNKKGRTLFLEDYEPWFEKITHEHPELEAYKISYPVNITQWQELMDKPEKLKVELPSGIKNQSWDVILVDGPRGHNLMPETPGRMSSIYMASQLHAKGGYVFVHDAERYIESSYAEKYLGKDHFVGKVRGRALLLIYHFASG